MQQLQRIVSYTDADVIMYTHHGCLH